MQCNGQSEPEHPPNDFPLEWLVELSPYRITEHGRSDDVKEARSDEPHIAGYYPLEHLAVEQGVEYE